MTSPSTTHPATVRTAVVPVLPFVLLVALVVALLAASGALTGGPAALMTTPEQGYLDTVRAQGVAGPDDALLGTARNACALLTSGGDARRVAFAVAEGAGIDAPTARTVLRAAAHLNCPAQEARITG